jgi:hypothetical protein
MLKFKSNGKIVGVLKDEANEPEGEAFKYKNEVLDMKTAEPKEEPEEEEDATV